MYGTIFVVRLQLARSSFEVFHELQGDYWELHILFGT